MSLVTREIDRVPEGVENTSIDVGTNGVFQFAVESFGVGVLQIADPANIDRAQHFCESGANSRDRFECV